MKKLLFITIASSLCVASSVCADNNDMGNFYIKGGVGYDIFKKSRNLRNTPVFELGAGYHINENLRTDVTLTYKNARNIKDTGIKHTGMRFRSMSAVINGYYDIATFGMVTPFINAGIGIARNTFFPPKPIDLTDPDVKNSQILIIWEKTAKTTLTWNVGAGASFDLGSSAFLDFNYRFVNFGKFKNSKVTAELGPEANYKHQYNEPYRSAVKSHEFIVSFRKNI